jgi:hypothetical protein
MVNDKLTAIRLPQDAVDRAGKLAKILARRPQYGGMRMTGSAVLRLALLRGLDAMETETKKGRS